MVESDMPQVAHVYGMLCM